MRPCSRAVPNEAKYRVRVRSGGICASTASKVCSILATDFHVAKDPPRGRPINTSDVAHLCRSCHAHEHRKGKKM